MRQFKGIDQRNIEKCGLTTFRPQSERPLGDFRLSQRPTFRAGRPEEIPGRRIRRKAEAVCTRKDSFERGWQRRGGRLRIYDLFLARRSIRLGSSMVPYADTVYDALLVLPSLRECHVHVSVTSHDEVCRGAPGLSCVCKLVNGSDGATGGKPVQNHHSAGYARVNTTPSITRRSS
jgi:hypothetical protein